MHNKSKKIISLVLSTTFAVSFVLTNGVFNQAKADDVSTAGSTQNTLTKAQIEKMWQDTQKDKFSSSDPLNRFYSKYNISKQFNDNLPVSTENPDQLVRVIVEMSQKPVVKTSVGSLNVTESANQAKISDAIESVKASQDAVKKQVLALPQAKIRHTYGYLINGFSAVVKKSDISKIKAMKDVISVQEANVYKPDMTSAKGLSQVYDAWKDLGYKGEGTVVAIVDTGIDYTHKDMRAPQDSSKDKLTQTSVNSIIKNTVGDGGKYYTDKVPYGYNFADDNQEVTDRTSSMHGMHVAGIVAADGTDAEVAANKAIQGVAPEAQLLAMKVFSNDPNSEGAYSDDIAAAIDSSVQHGADVINMSLGSTAAYQDPTDVEQVAIKNATDKGVVVVVSAGNSQYSTAPYKIPGVPDTGLVGSPGLAKDALQVASYENTNTTSAAFKYTAGTSTGTMAYTTSELDPTTIFKADQSLNLVDCGLGNTSDFDGKDLTGKIALIQRGGITFVDKKKNAQAAGAAGVIVYNKTGDNTYISMATDPSITIPSVFITNADGVQLKSLLASGLTVNYTGDVKTVANPLSGNMSDFTSWGPTPNLDFKPEITAPGGNIYSTVNNNKYESMSGTSMASPFTAGSEALIAEAAKTKNLGLTGRALVDFAKNTAINTAKTEIDPASNLPYSPRRQGAGLVQVKDAINNSVIVTQNLPGDEGRAVVPLQQIGKTTTFDLTLTNYGSKDATYALSDLGGALTEQPDFAQTMSYDVNIAGSTVKFDKSSVTVPAKGTAKVTVTIQLPDTFDTEQFVEGYVKFNSSDATVPSLVVPYMGFYGDWSKPQIIDSPIWTPNYYLSGSQLLSSEGNSSDNLYYLGATGEDQYGNVIVDPDKIAISPNGEGNGPDGDGDTVIPYLGFLRNAKTLKIQVLDSKGNVVRQCAYDSNITKDVFATETSSGGRKFNSAWAWDGKVFNSATGKYEYAKDGQYTLRVSAAIDYKDAKDQVVDMPVKVDNEAPQVNITSPTTSDSTKYTVKWTATDAGGSGVVNDDNLIIVNGKSVKADVTQATDGTYSCDLDLPQGLNTIIVAAGDYAKNLGANSINVSVTDTKPLSITFDNLKTGDILSSKNIKAGNVYTVTGVVNKAYGKFTIDGVPVQTDSIDSKVFAANVTLQEGKNKVDIYMEDTDGKKVFDYSIPVYLDTQAPIFNITSPTVTNDSTVVNEVYDGKMNVKGHIYDGGMGYTLTVNGEQLLNSDNETVLGDSGNGKDFDLNLLVSNTLSVIAKDTVGNINSKNIAVTFNAPTVTGVEPNRVYKEAVKPIFASNATATLDGKAYDGSAVSSAGYHTLVVTDANGKTTIDFKIDPNAIIPAKPSIHASTIAITNSPVAITIDGWQDAFKKEYRLVMGEVSTGWKDYTGSFDMTVNGTVYARATDSLGTVSQETYLAINNILTAPILTANITTPTNKDVTVTIDYPGTAVIKKYSEDGNTWKDYTSPITVAANEKVYAKSVDSAGNESSVATLDIANIDKTAPAAPVISLDITKPTSKGVTASIAYPADSVKNEYSLDGKIYTDYTAPVFVDQNGTVYARATDAVGNTITTNVSISNVDKTSKPFKLTKKLLDGTGYLKATVNVSKYTEYDAAPVVVFELFKKTAGSAVLTPVSIVTGQKSLSDSEDMTAGFNITDSASNYTVKAFVVDSLTNDAASVGTSLADSIDLGK